ncbi:hypothetical protein ACFO26_08265 [Lactococcus nasutitermitis]|uniref:Uncharacterized protein n=1 Tax=Lactococcus nasutitermitis TaxID=1652957 RepID=A0ABV9JEM3_9LACT
MQFFLENMINVHRHLIVQEDNLEAQLMVSLAEKQSLKNGDIIHFDKGMLIYKSSAENKTFDVNLTDGTEIILSQ